MNNETTASQPMQELVRDLYNFEGGRNFALRLEKILASQPKSIGDDAKFLELLGDHTSEYETLGRYGGCEGDTEKGLAPLVAYIHEYFRAPAAQASATIQAAPIYQRREEGGLWTDTTLLGKQAWDDAGWPTRVVVAIQEPVMVAEPMGVAALINSIESGLGEIVTASHSNLSGTATNVRYVAEELQNEIDAYRLAAPMVADPACVALTVWCGAMPESNGKSNFTALLMRKGGDMVDGITLERSEYPDRVRYEADRVRYLLGELPEPPFILDYDADKHSGYVPPAATVKAVPSEALEFGHVSEGEFGFPQYFVSSFHMGRWREAGKPKVIVYLAAPLADKTGGGE